MYQVTAPRRTEPGAVRVGGPARGGLRSDDVSLPEQRLLHSCESDLLRIGRAGAIEGTVAAEAQLVGEHGTSLELVSTDERVEELACRIKCPSLRRRWVIAIAVHHDHLQHVDRF